MGTLFLIGEAKFSSRNVNKGKMWDTSNEKKGEKE